MGADTSVEKAPKEDAEIKPRRVLREPLSSTFVRALSGEEDAEVVDKALEVSKAPPTSVWGGAMWEKNATLGVSSNNMARAETGAILKVKRKNNCFARLLLLLDLAPPNDSHPYFPIPYSP